MTVPDIAGDSPLLRNQGQLAQKGRVAKDRPDPDSGRTLPSVAKELFPAVKQDDVQLPLLLDFAKHNSNPGVVQR